MRIYVASFNCFIIVILCTKNGRHATHIPMYVQWYLISVHMPVFLSELYISIHYVLRSVALHTFSAFWHQVIGACNQLNRLTMKKSVWKCMCTQPRLTITWWLITYIQLLYKDKCKLQCRADADFLFFRKAINKEKYMLHIEV